jgi:hypothetical protein
MRTTTRSGLHDNSVIRDAEREPLETRDGIVEVQRSLSAQELADLAAYIAGLRRRLRSPYKLIQQKPPAGLETTLPSAAYGLLTNLHCAVNPRSGAAAPCCCELVHWIS